MIYPIGSMYGIFTYIWLIFMVYVGKYTIHGSYGYEVVMIIIVTNSDLIVNLDGDDN